MQQKNKDLDAAMACVTKGIHAEVVSYVQKRIPDSGLLTRLAEFFKLFGDGTRLGILWALSES